MKAKILIVEDNPLDEAMLLRAANKAKTDIEVVVRATFAEAIQAVVNPDDFDLILTDYFLPGADTGADVARESRIPTVVMTGADPQEIKKQAERAGAIACVSKSELLEDGAIDRLIRQAQTSTPGVGPTALEVTQKAQIEQMTQLISELETRRGGVLGVLDWIAKHRGLSLIIIAVVFTGIIAAILIGSWPGE